MADAHSNNVATAQPVRGRPFARGVSGNPGGRPVGSKNRIQADFLRELADHFAQEGRRAIERMCEEDPAAYVKVVASLMPKDVKLSAQPLHEMSDDDIYDAIATIKRYLDAGAPPIGIGATIEGEALALPAPDERS